MIEILQTRTIRKPESTISDFFIMENEIWKPVVGHENICIISSIGRKKHLIGDKRQTKITFGFNTIGYKGAKIKGKIYKIHRLVAMAFIPNPENKPCVNHINGIRSDNRVENLEWCTHSENTIHAHKSGLIIFTEERKSAMKKWHKDNPDACKRVNKVINIKTGIIYQNVKDASKSCDIKHTTLHYNLRNNNKTDFRYYK